MLGVSSSQAPCFQGAKSIVINREDALTRRWSLIALTRVSTVFMLLIKLYGLIIDPERSVVSCSWYRIATVGRQALLIKGRHNLLNAGSLSLRCAGLPLDSMPDTLQHFTGLDSL
jgi:UDP-N-acetylmuramoylalanine--D-glutamate ligase